MYVCAVVRNADLFECILRFAVQQWRSGSDGTLYRKPQKHRFPCQRHCRVGDCWIQSVAHICANIRRHNDKPYHKTAHRIAHRSIKNPAHTGCERRYAVRLLHARNDHKRGGVNCGRANNRIHIDLRTFRLAQLQHISSVFLIIGSSAIIAAFISLHILTVKHSFRRQIQSGELNLIEDRLWRVSRKK